MASLERILVPTDFSAGSYAALGYAVFLAQRLGSWVEVLAVAEAPEARDAVEDKLRRFLSDIPGSQGVELHHRVEAGAPAEQIVRAAREDDVDLIAMGTRGLGGAAAVGSVVHAVIRDAPCPVLAVRVKQAQPA